MAEALGKTVDEILLGGSRPMSSTEFRYWAAYISYKRELQEESHNRMMEESSEPEEDKFATMGKRY